MNSRLEVLKSLASQKPRDAFVRYGLAMEYANANLLEEAVSEFREILAFQPDYAAAYYHCGRSLERLDRRTEAAGMYRQGIEVTSRSGDGHARSELEEALEALGIDG